MTFLKLSLTYPYFPSAVVSATKGIEAGHDTVLTCTYSNLQTDEDEVDVSWVYKKGVYETVYDRNTK